MEVLQTSPLGLLGTAPEPVSISKSDGVCQLCEQGTDLMSLTRLISCHGCRGDLCLAKETS